MRRLLRHLKRFRREERGAILVEMTLITPLMIVLSAGVFEFGNLIHQKLLIEAGLRDYYLAEAERLRADFDKSTELTEKLSLGRAIESFLDRAADYDRRIADRA